MVRYFDNLKKKQQKITVELKGQATVKRRKKSAAAPNPKKMFEESQMVRRVKAYLNNLKVVDDEIKLHEMSLECEPAHQATVTGGAGQLSNQRSRRHASPAPSTTSSTSSASDDRKPATAKFGSHFFVILFLF